jgi:hypothetical protein
LLAQRASSGSLASLTIFHEIAAGWDGLQPQPFSDTIWFSQIAVISGLLDWKDLSKIVEAYDAGSRRSADLRDPKFLAALEKGDPRAHCICLDLAEAFLDTIELMRGQKGLLNAADAHTCIAD